ncbi:MAG: hypothetical protein O3C21_13765 [Verrucomicrobia bacterium]|nr:hypothetical protein [Verrucomicrobiota bacterium]
MLASREEIETFIQDFEACTLPKPKWTHHAHLVVALWYLSHHDFDDALNIVRRRIRAYNAATGVPNSDNEGYHETLTRLYLLGVEAHIKAHPETPMLASLPALLQTPLSDKSWPLGYYSRERISSVVARRDWLSPDQVPPDSNLDLSRW